MNTKEYSPRRNYRDRFSPSSAPAEIDPDKGYARFSYNHQPPERPGYRVVHVEAHQRKNVWLPDRWFYTRVDKNGLMYRGRDAKARMTADGLTKSVPDVRDIPSPDNITLGGGSKPGAHTRKSRARLYQSKTQGKKRGPYKKRMVGAQVVAKERASASNSTPIGRDTSVWIPVRGVGELIHGWFDLQHGQYVRIDQLQPEGLAGTIYRSGSLVFTENFVDALDQFTKVR